MSLLPLRVRSVTQEAPGVNCYELVDPRELELPPFSAGAHLDVAVPGGAVRQYSLCNDPRERDRYVIGVLRVEDGRGGSAAMHGVRPGDVLAVSTPRNNFPLVEDAARHLLIAGGIGVTPMMAMVERLDAMGADFTLHYCTRSAERTPFRRRLDPLVRRGRVVYHHDGGDPSTGLRVDGLLRDHAAGTHLYVCGPAGLMAGVRAAVRHWPQGSVHFEAFGAAGLATASETAAPKGEPEFSVRIASTGATLGVMPGRSIVQTLREAGIECATSCEAGVCRTCRTRYLGGTPEHHDLVLEDCERGEYVLICCARAKSSVLVLDL